MTPMPAVAGRRKEGYQPPGPGRYTREVCRTLPVGSLIFRVALLSGRQIKHHNKMFRPAKRKINIAATAESQLFASVGTVRSRTLHRSGQTLEALHCDHSEELAPVTKMAVGSVVGNTGSSCDLAESEPVGTNFGDQRDGGVDECLFQFPVMVRAAGMHRDSLYTIFIRITRRICRMQQQQSESNDTSEC